MILNTQKLPKTWEEIGFKPEATADTSPTLRMLQGTSESMHHSGGALEETELIYTSLIQEKLAQLQKQAGDIDFVVVGLGLGYIEMIIAREVLRFQIDKNRIRIYSFESVPELRNLFQAWFSELSLSEEIQSVYGLIDSMLNPDFLEIRSLLKSWHSQQQLVLLAELNSELPSTVKADCILFDAFSAKTSPQLWTEDFLVDFLKQISKPGCTLSTYASRSSLKNALTKANFSFQTRDGFKGKRNSTRAQRN